VRDFSISLRIFLSVILSLPLVGSASAWELSNPAPLAGNVVSVSAPSPDTCWIADNYGGIAVTVDGGDSWSQVSLPEFWWGEHLLDFQTGRSGWVFEHPRLPWETARCYRTIDGGETWEEFAVGIENEIFISLCFAADSGCVIAGGYDGSNEVPVIFQLVENTFERVVLPQGTSGSVASICILSGRSVWVTGEQGYFAFSPNGGASWQQAQTGVNTSFSSVAFINNQVGWIGGGNFNNAVLLKTVNGGGTWRAVEGLEATSEIVGLTSFSRSGIAAISKGGGEDDLASILITRDGASWQRISSTSSELFTTMDATSEEIWVGGQKGLLLHSTDGGNAAPVGQRVTTAQLTDISFSSPTNGWAVGEGAIALKTDDGGTTWSMVQSFGGWNVIRVVAISDERVITTCADSREYLSVDRGAHWREIAISDQDVYQIKRFSASLIAASGGSLVISTVEGENWTTKQVSELSITDFTLAGESMLAALSNGPVMRSDDGGDRWSPIEGIPENCEAIFHFDAMSGWALCTVDMELRLLFTHNGWETYNSVRSIRSFYDWVFTSATEGWFAGSFVSGDILREGLWRLSDRGFRREQLDLPVGRVTGIASTDADHIWICGADGLLAKLTGEVESVANETAPTPFALNLIQAYPNPTNGRVTLRWNAALHTPLSFDLFGSDGRSGRSFRAPTGATRFGIELEGLPAGTYYLKSRTLTDQPIPIVLVK